MLVQIILTDPISLPILSPTHIVDIEKIVGEVEAREKSLARAKIADKVAVAFEADASAARTCAGATKEASSKAEKDTSLAKTAAEAAAKLVAAEALASEARLAANIEVEAINLIPNALGESDFVLINVRKLWASKQYNMGWLELGGSAVQINLRVNKKLIASYSVLPELR